MNQNEKSNGSTILSILMLVSLGGCSAENTPLSDDLQYQFIYDAAVQVAEIAGYEKYEIEIDEENNATIKVLDESGELKESVDLGKLQFAHDPNNVAVKDFLDCPPTAPSFCH